MRNTRVILAFLAVLTAQAVTVGCTVPTPARPLEKVVIGTYPAEWSGLIFIAEKNGYFAAEGLDAEVRMMESGPAAIKELEAGKLDIAGAAEFPFVSLSAGMPDLRILASVTRINNVSLIARKDFGILTPQDLKGKQVGLVFQSNADYYLGLFLLYNGMSLGDIERVNLSPAGLVDNITEGKIGAVIIWEPHVYNIMRALGDKAVAWPAQYGLDFYWLLITRTDILMDRPLLGEKVLRALVKAENFVRSYPDEARDIVGQRLAFSDDYMAHAWQKGKFEVTLPRSLTLAMEDQTRWLMQNGLPGWKEMPNYLNLIHFGSLQAVRPESITIVH